MSVLSKERLTERNEANTAYYFPLCFEKCNGLGASSKCDRCEVIESVCGKLGEYEDLDDLLREKLTDVAVDIITASKKDYSEWIDRISWTSKRCDELAREVQQYRELEEQGLFLRLPCKVGDTIYIYADIIIAKAKCVGFKMQHDDWRVVCENQDKYLTYEEFKDVFLTKSEAEEKLRELEGK